MNFQQTCSDILANKTQVSEARRLHQLFDAWWEFGLETSPETATFVGRPEFGDRWTDLSPEGFAYRKEGLLSAVQTLSHIQVDTLDAEDHLNYDLFKYNLDQMVESLQYKDELLQLTPMRGFHESTTHVLAYMPNRNLADYEQMLRRFAALPRHIEETIALLQQGLSQGITPPQISMRNIPEVIHHLYTSVVDSPWLMAFDNFPESISSHDQDHLRRAAEKALEGEVFPALERLHHFLRDTYVPGCRTTHGYRDLPGGEAWYKFVTREQTTTHLTPEEIHEIGLSEVSRIHREFHKVMVEANFDGTFEEFSTFLRTDPQFFHTSAEDLLQEYRDICKRADPELVKMFGRLPRLPYGVKAVPPHSEKQQTTAYYLRGSLAAGRPGWFFANTYNLASRPRWEMEALSLHEAVPGHHLQIAIAQELEGLPEFRKEGGYNAYVEGWGLYSESLGKEMGFYRDPYSRYGLLTYEMWRAVRLVLDTGIHALGWSREKAIDYFKRNTSKSEHDIAVEVDRYMVMPGQALSYKIGQLKIRELRAYATRELGPRFDMRGFHDEILGHGALPLDLLEALIHRWVSEKKNDVHSESPT